MRAGIYVRISQDRAGGRGGVERQVEDCRALCAARSWSVAGVYEDNDTSAYGGGHRPSYERLLGDVADGLVDVVVAWHPDRLWRSVIEQQVALAAWRASGLALVATCSGGEVDPSSADDGFVATVIAAVAEKESADKARRARRKAESLVAEGRHTGGGLRPFGHTADRSAVVDHEAALVVEAAQRLLAGETLADVCFDWRQRGEVTATGRPWRYTSLLKLLRQPRLAALSVHRGRIVGEASWPPILDRPTWERLQATLDARAVGPRRRPSRHLLGGVLSCGQCGAALVANAVGYRCPSRSQGGCGGVAVPGRWVEEVVAAAVVARVASPAFAEALAARAASSEGLDDALAAVADAEARLVTLDAMFSAGELVAGDFRTMRARLVEVLTEAQDEVAALSGSPVVPAGDLDWDGLDTARRRAVVVAVVERVEVAPAGRGRPSTPERLAFSWR